MTFLSLTDKTDLIYCCYWLIGQQPTLIHKEAENLLKYFCTTSVPVLSDGRLLTLRQSHINVNIRLFVE